MTNQATQLSKALKHITIKPLLISGHHGFAIGSKLNPSKLKLIHNYTCQSVLSRKVVRSWGDFGMKVEKCNIPVIRDETPFIKDFGSSLVLPTKPCIPHTTNPALALEEQMRELYDMGRIANIEPGKYTIDIEAAWGIKSHPCIDETGRIINGDIELDLELLDPITQATTLKFILYYKIREKLWIPDKTIFLVNNKIQKIVELLAKDYAIRNSEGNPTELMPSVGNCLEHYLDWGLLNLCENLCEMIYVKIIYEKSVSIIKYRSYSD